ncbi:MAG: PKD domain-containing protein [Candidatus Thermoplasmatota archaeon]|nr:PKD domain-containing protein [Candidatus Thermoplasmatota archaeon]
MKISKTISNQTLVISIAISCLLVPAATIQMHTGITTAQDPGTRLHLQYTLSFSPQDIVFDTAFGYDTVTFKDAGFTTEAGSPLLPVQMMRVALPGDMRATDVQILESTEYSLPGEYRVLPAQPSQKLSFGYYGTEPYPPNPEVYQSHLIYPSNIIELIDHCDLAGQAMATLAVYPVRYVPSQKTLVMLSSVTFLITAVQGYHCGDYLPMEVSNEEYTLYQHLVEDLVINTEDVVLRSSTTPQPSSVEPGDYEYVIITQDSWVSAFQPLADWKTQKGVPATIVTTSWIYNSGGYSGTNVEKLRSFVHDVHDTWGSLFVLLGGDTSVVPCHYRTISSVDPEPIANDAYYADYDDDWVCEVHVGRASVTGPGTAAGQIGNFINKILSYEKNPPLTGFAKTAGFFGFDLDSSTPAENCKIYIDNNYLPSGWTLTTVYDSQGGNHKTNVINALNAGQNLMNHADHCGSDFMGTGYVNHYGMGLGNSDMDALSNGNKQGILYSMGCWPAAYDESNCIAEHFVRDANGGGIAFVGNSRYGWYNPGYTNTLSMKYDRYFFKSLFQDDWDNLGIVFSDHKNDAYQSDSYYKYCYTELTLLGDPELPIWKDNPVSMTASFPTQIDTGAQTFTVSVTSGGSPVYQADVCLWKGTEVYLTGTTNSAGQKTFSITPTTQGQLFVTVTKHNYLPFEGITLVMGGNNNPPATPATPTGQTAGITNEEYTYATSTTDPEGDHVWYQWNFGDSTTDWLGPYPSGTPVQASHTWTAPGTYYVKVKAKDLFEYESSWSTSLPVTVTEAKPNLTIGTLTGELVGVSTLLKNNGNADATNVHWSITLSGGGFLLAGQSSAGTIPTLQQGDQSRLQDSPLLGFGEVTITVKVQADGVPEVTKTAQGFVLFIFVILY